MQEMRAPFALLLSLPLSVCAADNTIRQTRDIVRDIVTESSSHKRIDLSAEVTFVGKVLTNFWVLGLCDTSGCAVADASNLGRTYVPVPGDTIHCTGYTESRRTASRHAVITQARFVSHQQPPAPIPATVSELLDGKYDNQFIRLSGIVYDAQTSETNPEWMHLTIAGQGKIIYISLFDPGNHKTACEKLIGSFVMLDGLCMQREDGNRRHLGRTVKVFGLSSVQIAKPASDGKNGLPDIMDLRGANAEDIPFFDRYRTTGIVIATWDRHAIVATTNGTTFSVDFATEKTPALGQSIHAIGFPETDLFHLNLSRATWFDCKDGNAFICGNEPENITPQLKSDHHGQTVKIIGTILTTPSQSEKGTMIYVRNGNQVTAVHVNPSWPFLSNLSIDSKIEVSGICFLDAEKWHPHLVYPRARGYAIITRSPADIRIIARPPYWTIFKLLILLGALLVVLIAIFIWNLALRRVATRKGRELFREQLGHVKADLRTEERTRLAVELHDTLAQNLTGVSMELEAANDLRGDAPKQMLDHLGIAAKALKSCRDELRNCLWDLRSQALEEQDMTKAVLRTLLPHINDSRLAVRFNVPRSRLSDNTAHALLRVIRELVINAIRHGNASAIKVAGTLDQGKLLCSVTDNGCGFDAETVSGVLQGHFGLQGIRERIDEIGGTFEITSAPGKGTKAVITLTARTEG